MIRVFALVFALAAPTFEQNTQWPCPGVFMYEPPQPDTEPGRWYGVAHLSTDTILDLVSLNIVLDNKADILGIWIGELTTEDNKEFKIEIKNITLTPGSPLAVRFYVQYKAQKKIPRLRAITMNGREICNVNRPQPAVGSQIRPDETSPTRPIEGQPVPEIKSGGGEVPETPNSKLELVPVPPPQAQAPRGASTTETVTEAQSSRIQPAPAPPSQAPAPRARDASTTTTANGRVVVAAPLPLIVIGGSPTLEGQWPWQIPLYEAQIRVFAPVFALAAPAFGQNTQWPYPGVFMYEPPPPPPIGGQPVADINSGGGEDPETQNSRLELVPAPAPQAQAPRGASTTKTNTQWPCPGVFMYEPPQPDTEPGRWYGVALLSTDTTLDLVSLNIVLDNKADILGIWIGELTTEDNKEFKIEIKDIKLTPGSPLAVRFYVQYKTQKKIPRLRAIRMNGREICNVNRPQPAVGSPIRPDETSPTRPIGGQPVADKNSGGGEVPETRNSVLQLTPAPPSQAPALGGASTTTTDQCGRVVVAAPLPLIVNGSSTLEGQWPWQIALYEAQTVNNHYICGGTLVSPRHVITAAHCVPRNNSQGGANRNTFTVYLGKHNLRTSIKGVQVKLVEKIIVHPEYNTTTNSHDVAILELTEPVTYTDWVQPACLWPEDQIDLTNVIGKTGLVPGWGFNDKAVTSEQLSMVRMPVVDTETCIRSNTEFFVNSTSEYTYCAGYRNGSSVCNGDSGGGMVFRIGDSWYLRGLVSRTVVKKNELTCDPTHYTVFADLAKLLPWIKRIVTDL